MHDFKVEQADAVVKTRLWHFINWDKQGTLVNPDIFPLFLQRLQNIEHSSQHPILVHSVDELNISSNLFLLLDICIRLAKQDGVVDMCHQVRKLRTQQPNCIATVEEYLFAHQYLDKYFSLPSYAYVYDHNPIIYFANK